MANKRIEIIMLKRIIQLQQKGLSNRKIATQLGIHRNSVNSYVSQLKRLDKPLPELLALPDKTLSSYFSGYEPRQDPRYKILQDLFAVYEKQLKKVGSTYQTLWYDYIRAHPDGYGYTRFKHHLQAWLKKQTVSIHMTHKMGDKLFIDFTGKKLNYIDKDTGEVITVEVFVAVLGGSQYTYVQAVESQQTGDLIRALNNSLSYLGGVPQAIVCDNLKSAVDKSSKYEPLLNKNMDAFGLHNNTTILPARAYKPQDYVYNFIM
ncbi:MAG: IS21 family transposase [Cytophagales bacterium]|nr:IS21 family transposase [Cytophagales bacterium]